MLHWLAGQKSHDYDDADTTAHFEPPETPAPVFAVRAFKHAIFGTPQTVQAKPPRRHSNNDATRPRSNGRPGMARPKSTSDAQTIGSLDVAVEEELVPSPLASPTKGILLTPGTATARRKTVSFGDHVVDNEGKRPLKSGLPDDCPGKFPSPWAKSFVDLDIDEPVEKPRGRSKLTEALEQVREESVKRKSKSSKQKRSREDADVTTDLAEPQSESGIYWEQEYNIYRERTTIEVRKLVEKNQLARRYAREKDTECTDLRELLRREQRKVEKLERRTAELEAQLLDFQQNLKGSDGPEQGMKVSFDLSRRDSASAIDVPATDPQRERPARPERRKHIATQQLQERKTESHPNPAKEEEQDFQDPPTAVARETLRTRPKSRPDRVRTITNDDPWAQTFASSTVESTQKAENGPPSPSRETPDYNMAKNPPALDSKPLIEQTHSIALEMGLQPPSPVRERRQDSPMRELDNPLPPPKPQAKISRRPVSPSKTANDDISIPAPESSPFLPDAVSERPHVLTGAPVPIKAALRPLSRNRETIEKPPSSMKVEQPRNDENQKPSAAWHAMSAPVGETVGSTVPNNNPGTTDRLAAAKARIASRGRQIS